jgi:peptidoglycan biosynthesis protein MviN/MurJ (putative lipid II flippase)
LIALGKTRQYAGSMVHGTLTVVVLSLVLAKFLGAPGAAIALLAGEAVALGFMFTRFNRLIRVNPLRFVARPLIVSALLAAGLWWCHPSRVAAWAQSRGLTGLSHLNLDRLAFLVLVILAIAIYFGIMYLVGGFGKEELALLRSRDAE